MWSKSYSKIYKGIKKELAWQAWSNVNEYIKWHNDLDYCHMEGDFKEGNYFLLKPKGAPTFKIEIVELIENQRFVDCTRFWGAKMYDIHELEQTDEGLRIISTIKVTGILSLLWVNLVAKHVANSVPHEMDALVKFAMTKNEGKNKYEQ